MTVMTDILMTVAAASIGAAVGSMYCAIRLDYKYHALSEKYMLLRYKYRVLTGKRDEEFPD